MENCDQLPGRDAWLVARRSLRNPDDIAYYLSNTRPEMDLLTLARVASTRYTVEQCLEEAKGETGLDHAELLVEEREHRTVLPLQSRVGIDEVRNRYKTGGQGSHAQ